MNQEFQPEQYLWSVFQDAVVDPENADLGLLWHILEQALEVLDSWNQLWIAGEAIAQIADMFHARSQLMFEDLDAVTGSDGPVMPEDAFACFVRQSMQLDFDEFIEPLPSFGRKPYSCPEQKFDDGDSSIVGAVDKEALLQVIEQHELQLDPETAYTQALNTAHAEDASAWIGAIARYLDQQSTHSVRLSQLKEELQIPLAEIWLGLLLGSYLMHSSYAEDSYALTHHCEAAKRSDSFYTSEIWIDCKSPINEPCL